MSAAEARFGREEDFERGLERFRAAGFKVSQEQGAAKVFREALVHRVQDGAAFVLVWDAEVPAKVGKAFASVVLALVAVLVVLASGPAYARAAKESAPHGLASGEAQDQRGEHSMAAKKTTARATARKAAPRAVELAPALRDRVASGQLDNETESADEETKWLVALESEDDPARRRVLARFEEHRDPLSGKRTALAAYAPSEEGMLAARLCDGEARLPWSPPDETVSESDFETGQELFETVVRAFASGDRGVLDRLGAALVILNDKPQSKGDRLRSYLDTIEQYVERTHRENGRAEEALAARETGYRGLVRDMFQAAYLSINALARDYDPAFKKLDPWEFHDALLSVQPSSTAEKNSTGRPKGGRGKRSAVSLAAHLAAKVGAFSVTDEKVFAVELSRLPAKARAPKK